MNQEINQENKENQKVNQEQLQTTKKSNAKTSQVAQQKVLKKAGHKDKLLITFLGGVGEIGKNITASMTCGTISSN